MALSPVPFAGGGAQHPGTPGTVMVPITPDDDADLEVPMFIRADAAGVVAFWPLGNLNANPVTLNMLQGEWTKVLVRRVKETTAVTVHGCCYGAQTP